MLSQRVLLKRILSKKAFLKRVSLLVSVLTLAACAAMQNGPQNLAATEEPPAIDNNDLYEVCAGDKVYVFDDVGLYQSYLQTGQVGYSRVRDKADVQGRHVVFVLKTEDQNKPDDQIGAIGLYNVSLPAGAHFYGEIRSSNGRIYIFSRAGEMKPVQETGTAQFGYTQIAAGPQGETLVFVLGSDNNTKKPEALIAEYKKRHQL